MENNKTHTTLSPELQAEIRKAQVNEVTEYHIYKHLSRVTKSAANKGVLNRIAEEELEHYRFWMNYNDEVEPRWWQVRFYTFIAGFLGLVFAMKLLERSESAAYKRYNKLARVIPEVAKLAQDEFNHEKALVNMLSDLRLKSFGTWQTAMNLVFFSLAGMLVILWQFSESLQESGIILVLTGLLVTLSDTIFTLLLKNPGKIRGEQFLRALFRLISGLMISVLAALPFFFSYNGIAASAISLIVVVIISLSVNFYSSIISDHKLFQRLLRVIASFVVVVAVIWIAGWLLRMLPGF
jgi:VIT1/CCC1 family predicted Fe2+/Mn2+ transporter